MSLSSNNFITHTHTHTFDVTDLSTRSSLSLSFANLFSNDKFCTISQLIESHAPKTVNIHDVNRLRNYEQQGASAGVPHNEHCMAWKQWRVYLTARRCSKVTSHCSYAKFTSFSFSADSLIILYITPLVNERRNIIYQNIDFGCRNSVCVISSPHLYTLYSSVLRRK